MALVLADRVKETTTTAGTGTVTLLGAATGFQSFAVIGNANTTYYAIVAQTGTEWEVGIGTYTLAGTLLARTTVLSNSAGTQPTALTFSAGTKDVFVTYPAGKSVNLDASGNATALGTPASFVGTNITGTASGLTAGNVTGVVAAINGGTGQSSYAVGDLLYASTTTALSKLADVATGNALISGGIGVAPSYGKIGLTTHVSGTLPVLNGGTGVTTSTGTGNNVLSASPTFTGTITASAYTGDGAFTLSNVATNISLGASQTTGTWVGGGTAQTGAITLGQSTAAQTLNIATGATATATTKTVNIGTGGLSGSTTNINIGSSVATSTTTNTVYGPLRLAGTTSGYVGLKGAAAAGATTYTLPAADGTSGQVLSTNGTATLSWATAGGLTITDDTTTAATRYLTFTSATSGSITGANVSSTKLTYNPSTGALSATTVTGSSDARLKTNWRDLPKDFVEQLATVKSGIYDRTDHDVPLTQVGVPAQDLRPVLPHAVLEDSEGMLSVAYGNAALVSAIQLAQRVIEQDARIAKLEALVAQLIQGKTP